MLVILNFSLYSQLHDVSASEKFIVFPCLNCEQYLWCNKIFCRALRGKFCLTSIIVIDTMKNFRNFLPSLFKSKVAIQPMVCSAKIILCVMFFVFQFTHYTQRWVYKPVKHLVKKIQACSSWSNGGYHACPVKYIDRILFSLLPWGLGVCK